MSKKVLITGGNGGIAIAIKEELERERNCDTFSAAWYLKK